MLRPMQSTNIPSCLSQKQPPLDADLHHLVKEIRESFLSFLDRCKAEQIQTDQDELINTSTWLSSSVRRSRTVLSSLPHSLLPRT